MLKTSSCCFISHYGSKLSRKSGPSAKTEHPSEPESINFFGRILDNRSDPEGIFLWFARSSGWTACSSCSYQFGTERSLRHWFQIRNFGFMAGCRVHSLKTTCPMSNRFREILFCVLIFMTMACSNSENRLPPRVYQEGMIGPNASFWSAKRGCYSFNQEAFGRNPRLIDISWCRKKLRYPPDSYARASWEIPISPSITRPLNEYKCFSKTVSNFGSRIPWYIQKRCKKLDSEE